MDFSSLLTKHGFTQAADEQGFLHGEKEEAQSLPGTEDKEADNEKEAGEAQPKDKEKGRLVKDEERDQGAVKLGVYLTYFKEGGSILWLLFLGVYLGGFLTRVTQVRITEDSFI